jgi:Lrp/AsnC family leucine-responsive transcriptional regulator
MSSRNPASPWQRNDPNRLQTPVQAKHDHENCHSWLIRLFFSQIVVKAATMDQIDRKLLQLLQQDGRMTAQALATRVGLSPSPCLRRIRIMEEKGIIRGYVALVDQKKVDLPVSVFISIKLERQREEELDAFNAAVSQWPEVVEAYLMTGQQDFLLRVVVSDLDAYERFLKTKLTRVEGVSSIQSSFALGQVKHTNVLPL